MISRLTQDAIRARIRQWLTDHDVPLLEVAARTGDSYQRIQRWLGAEVKIPADFLARLISTFPISAMWLLTGEGEPRPADPDEAQRFVGEVRRLLDAILS